MPAPALDPIAARVMRARTWLVLSQPFFGALALRLGLRPDASVPTAATDGRDIVYSPAFVAGLTDEELRGLFAHEVLHVALGHPWRRDARDPRRWNMACDHAINPLVIAAGLSLPAGALSVPTPAYPGLSAEAIYRHLPESDPESDPEPSDGDAGEGDGSEQGPDGAPGGPGPAASDDVTDPAAGDFGPGAVRDYPGTAAEAAIAEAEMRAAVVAAAQQARACGKLPGALSGAIEEAQSPVVDWRALLRRFVQAAASRDEYTWRLPNARFAHLGVYLPALIGEQCGPLAVVVDTSGSIPDAEIGQFAAEIRGIHADLHPAALHVLWADASVQRVDTWGPDDWPDFDRGAPGRGGTDFRPAFTALDAMEQAPVAVVYLADGEGPAPERAPAYPVLWVLTPGGRNPAGWGETVTLDIGQERAG